MSNKKYGFKAVVLMIALMVIISFFYSNIVDLRVSKFNGFTIVLDAGHGGRDGGSVGKNGTVEKEINLEYVMLLKQKFVDHGYRVVLTRKNIHCHIYILQNIYLHCKPSSTQNRPRTKQAKQPKVHVLLFFL